MYNYFSAVPSTSSGTELLVVELVIISVVELVIISVVELVIISVVELVIISVVELVETTDAEGSLYCV